MADSKITALTALTAADPINDMLPIVDVSDTTMAASGTTKKISVNNILSSSPTASGALTVTGLVTAGSATITGDLTVDTSTLKVDATNDRVGFGTASPAQFVHLSKSNTSTALTSPPVGGASLRIQNSSSTNNNFGSVEFYNAAGLFGASVNCQSTNQATPTNDLVFVTRGSSGGLEHYRIAADGVATWSEVGGIAGTAMTLNSTGLGIGVSPATSSKIHTLGNGTNVYAIFQNGDTLATNKTSQLWLSNGPTFLGANNREYRILNLGTSATAADLVFDYWTGTTIAERMRIDSSGNVGIGVTPAGTGGCLQLKSGVTFPATQVASADANTLDDYVESTFSPTIVGSTLAGTATYSTQIGRATKVGRLVTFSLRVIYTAGLGTGNLRIGGLPFTAGVSSNFSIIAENIALTAGNYPVAAISSGNTYIGIDQLPTGGGAAAAVPYDVSGDIQISGSYIV